MVAIPDKKTLLALPEETDVAILGAGPIGLDAALAMAEARRAFVVLESGPQPAAGIRSWGRVQLFSPWSMNLSERMRRCLTQAGLEARSDETCPTGNEFCDLTIDPIAQSPAIAPHLHCQTRVVAVGREGLLKHEEIGTQRRAEQPFRLLLDTPSGEQSLRARIVLDCTGGQHQPHWIGEGGIPAPGERLLAAETQANPRSARLMRSLGAFLAFSEGQDDAWKGERVLLVGSGHSAQTVAVALAKQDVDVTWVLRSAGTTIAPIHQDPLPRRSELQTRSRSLLDGENARFHIHRNTTIASIDIGTEPSAALTVELRKNRQGKHPGNQAPDTSHHQVDRIIALVGAVGDHELYRELQVQECYATSGPMGLAAALLGAADPENPADCLAQVSQGAETLVTPEPGYFILGNKSYGRNSAFLLRIGYQQIDDVLSLL